MSDVLANLFASKFIARKDVKAVQHNDGSWAPVTDNGKRDGNRLPWTRADLNAHLSGEQTYGHYLLNEASECKLFAFDVDPEKNKPDWQGTLPTIPMDPDNFQGWVESFAPADPREAWRDRAHPARDFMKIQFRLIAHRLVKAVEQELQIPVAAAYSGNKGIHVYGFTGPISADEAREGAMIVIDSLGDWKPSRGQNFFRCTNEDPIDGFPNLSIEVFPKQALEHSPHLHDTMMLNGERCPLAENEARVLADGDEIYLLAPLAGG